MQVVTQLLLCIKLQCTLSPSVKGVSRLGHLSSSGMLQCQEHSIRMQTRRSGPCLSFLERGSDTACHACRQPFRANSVMPADESSLAVVSFVSSVVTEGEGDENSNPRYPVKIFKT